MPPITEKQFFDLISTVKIQAVEFDPEEAQRNEANILPLGDFTNDSNDEDDWSLLHKLSVVESSLEELRLKAQIPDLNILIIACVPEYLHRSDVERLYSYSVDDKNQITLKLDCEVMVYDAHMWRMGVDSFDDVPISIMTLQSFLDALNSDAIGLSNHWITAILCHENGTPIEVS